MMTDNFNNDMWNDILMKYFEKCCQLSSTNPTEYIYKKNNSTGINGFYMAKMHQFYISPSDLFIIFGVNHNLRCVSVNVSWQQ